MRQETLPSTKADPANASSIAAATGPATLPSSSQVPQSDGSKLSDADTLIDAAIAAGKCPGAVLLVGRADAIVYEKAYGNRAIKPVAVATTLDTVYDLASLTKPLATATSIMLLAERGKVKLDEPVARYLPEFGQRGKEEITIADLLLHVGGLPPDDDLSDYADGTALAMRKVLAAPAALARHARFQYSDVGYIVLGELVRKVDGRSLDAFTRQEIFQPLGMVDTTFLPPPALQVRCAPTEMRDGRWMIGEVHDPRSHALGGVAGHAGLFSTAEDLSRFCRMILAGGALNGRRILKESTVADMIRPRPLPGDKPGFRAYGFDVDTAYSSPRGDAFPRGKSFGHTGFTGTALWLDPASRSYYILLTNSVHPDGTGTVKALRHDVGTVVGRALLGCRK